MPYSYCLPVARQQEVLTNESCAQANAPTRGRRRRRQHLQQPPGLSGGRATSQRIFSSCMIRPLSPCTHCAPRVASQLPVWALRRPCWPADDCIVMCNA